MKVDIGQRNMQHSYIPMQNTAGNLQIPDLRLFMFFYSGLKLTQLDDFSLT